MEKDNDIKNIYSDHSENLIGKAFTGVAEKTFQESVMDPGSLLKPFNPDELYQKTGDYSIYEEMLHDEQVHAGLQIKKDLVLGSGWIIKTSDDTQEEIKTDLRIALDEDSESDNGFESQLEEILSGYEFGFSLSEKLFKKRPNGSIGLRSIKNRHPNTWEILTDVHGNVEEYKQIAGNGNPVIIDPNSLVHYINRPRFQNPYGRSDLRPAYLPWFSKRQIVRYFAIFLEKAASPTPIARYDKNVPPDVVRKIFNTLKRFQSKTAITIPDELDVQFLEAKSKGEAYHKALDIFNMFIGRSLFLPDLIGLSGSETSGGSYALGQEHFNLFFKHIGRRRKLLERIVNKHFVKPISIWNHGLSDDFPVFEFLPINEDEIFQSIKQWIEATKSQIYKPTDEEIIHFKKLIKFPEALVEVEEPLPNPAPVLPKDPQDPQDPIPKENLPDENDKHDPIEDELKRDLERMAIGNKFIHRGPFKQTGGDFHKKTNFQLAETTLAQSVDSITEETQIVVNDSIAFLIDQIEKKNILKSGDISRFDSVNLKKSQINEMNKIVNTNLLDTFNTGKTQGMNELIKGNFQIPVASAAFLALLKDENFQFVGDWEFALMKKTRVELIKAIKDGLPLSTVQGILTDAGKRLSDVQIERYSRTKSTEVLNKGRLEAFEESGVVNGFQYSAILDGRTTSICSGLHGKFFKSGSQPVPPMHFNCRSLLIPITKFEEFKETTSIRGKTPDEFIEDNIGEGFPKQ